MQVAELRFPLYERAEQLGILDGRSALILAPTATGKSHIGREAIRRALQRGGEATHAYLVPFRALAEEVAEAFRVLLQSTPARVRVVTGDYRDPLRPDEADLVVATYESFVALLRSGGFRPGVVVADEVHLIADDTRGPVAEGLLARLLASGRAQALCALSAVVSNGARLAGWLGIPLLEGTAEDRPVPLSLTHQVVDDLDGAVERLLQPCLQGRQALVFCSSRAGAEKAARSLAEALEGCVPGPARRQLAMIAEHIHLQDPAAEDVIELLPTGVAYHHAGLPKPIRQEIEDAFRSQLIRVVTCTPTLAAGVNLPADIVVVRDAFRSEVVRGVYRRVLLPSGEILNMLGRAGRPGQRDRGEGLLLLESRFRTEPGVEELIEAVGRGQGGEVASRLTESFEGLMQFVLAEVVERGDTSREDVARAFSRTLAHFTAPAPIQFDRPFEEDIMEDIPAYERVVKERASLRVVDHRLSAAGIHAEVDSRGKRYQVTLGLEGLGCTCPAASQFYRGKVCKHQALAVHHLLFGEGVGDEARQRAIYICGHLFGRTLDRGTLLSRALDLLTAWKLIERVPGGWRATPVGQVASGSGFDLLLVHQAVERIRDVDHAGYREVARWAVQDYFAKDRDRDRWSRALERWLDEADEREVPLPVAHRGDFERGLDDLSRVCLLYERSAAALGKPGIAREARRAAGAIRYGVAPELVPLMALQLPQLRRARSRYLFDRGITDLQALASADPTAIADPRRAPESLVREWVERARQIYRARAVAGADREEADAEFDELVARFRLDPAALS